MEGLLAGKTVVVTGAGSGVGRAAAGLFAQHGASVLCGDVDQARLDETVAEIRAHGGNAAGMVCDVADEAQVTALVAKAADRFGRLDVMYNNAGIASPHRSAGGPKTFAETTVEDSQRLVAVNVQGVVFGCQQAIARFKAQGGGGVIVNTASVAGLIGWGGVVYGATKGAVVSLTRALAMEVAREGIRVNAVCPAGMMTNFGSADGANPTPELVEAYSAMHPLGRPIDPLDCANAALFLASDLASNITGVNLPVDGGLTAG